VVVVVVVVIPSPTATVANIFRVSSQVNVVSGCVRTSPATTSMVVVVVVVVVIPSPTATVVIVAIVVRHQSTPADPIRRQAIA
jgi:hypothetical protein